MPIQQHQRELIDNIKHYKPVSWWQEAAGTVDKAVVGAMEGAMEGAMDGAMEGWIAEAQARLERFRPLFQAVAPETEATQGLIESPLVQLRKIGSTLSDIFNPEVGGQSYLFLKCDNDLPISGSIKARGGFHEVLAHAEELAAAAGILDPQQDYRQFLNPNFKALFKERKIVVGSTGNLGLSIGLMGSLLGFQVYVHMSKDAKAWKIAKLRASGTTVVLHEGDYGVAVATARQIAEADAQAYFVDDERSIQLFAGYAVGGRRLYEQLTAALAAQGLAIGQDLPLYVYLPCGVGGGPGGVAYGLKQVFGAYVHPIFVEPTHSPCFLLAMAANHGLPIDIGDYGLDNLTAADGLAVGCASPLALAHAGPLLRGIVTVGDHQLYRDLKQLADVEGIFLEPSALAGFEGLRRCVKEIAPRRGVHVLWATGGGLVPLDERDAYYNERW